MADNAGVRKHPPRRNMDARREQNRQASRNYREKRKQRLALLDQILGPGEISEASGRMPLERQAPEAVSPEPREMIQSGGTITENGPIYALPGTRSHEPSQAAREISASLMCVDEFDDVEDIQRQDDFDVSSNTLNPYLLSRPVTTVEKGAGSWISIFDHPMVTPTWPRDLEGESQNSEVAKILGSIENLTESQRRNLLKELQSRQGSSANSSSQSQHTTITQNWVSAGPQAGRASTRLQAEARRFAAFIDTYANGRVGPCQLARIYVAHAGLYAALFANCYALGMSDVEPLMVEDGVSIFSIDENTGYQASQLAAVRPRFDGITPDLRPSDRQLTFGHHPYLDVMPFKHFRDAVINALDCDEPVLDEDEFCRDMNAGGLICWGSQQNCMGMEAGVPWDARSWEPSVWFLQKYHKYVGGMDGQMWKITRAWHDMRNEPIATSTAGVQGSF